MVDENIKLRIKTDPLFALEVFKSGTYYYGEDNEYLQQFAFTKLVSVGIISPKDFQESFELVDLHVFNPSHDFCRNLLETMEYKSIIITCIVLFYNDLFYIFKDDCDMYNEEYYYHACKVNNTEIMESEYRDGYRKDSCFDYSLYIFK